MEKYLRILLGIIVTILIFAFAIWVLPYVLIGVAILILIGWVYFKFIRKYVNKNKKEKTETRVEKKTRDPRTNKDPIITDIKTKPHKKKKGL